LAAAIELDNAKRRHISRKFIRPNLLKPRFKLQTSKLQVPKTTPTFKVRKNSKQQGTHARDARSAKEGRHRERNHERHEKHEIKRTVYHKEHTRIFFKKGEETERRI
jgi:hypothetical protein